jgi:hypothetical protein
MLSNSFSCIPGAINTNYWVSKNVSYELNSSLLATKNLQILINDTLSTNPPTPFVCSKMGRISWLGGSNVFPYNAKVIKSTFNMPPHQWVNIRFQVALIDKWINNTLLL